MGSAAAYHLAQRDFRVLGLDRFTPPHTMGSSHGESRIIRQAYFEDPSYVPIVRRAYELWRDLERATGMTLYRETGCLTVGAANNEIFEGARAAAEEHHVAHETLDAAELERRFPAYRPADGTMAVLEPRAGVLFPERCIEAHLKLADAAGATLQFDEPLEKWTPDGDGFTLRTSLGVYRADRLVMAGGAWTQQLAGRLELPLRVTRQRLLWFDPALQANLFGPERFPVFFWEERVGDPIYGIPNLGNGVKVGWHAPLEDVDPDSVDRDVRADEIAGMRATVQRCFRTGDVCVRSTQVCLYTNTPDAHFLLDFHPKRPGIVLASPCSGHGFKFSSAIGEILADLLTQGRSRFDLSLFKVDRLLQPRVS